MPDPSAVAAEPRVPFFDLTEQFAEVEEAVRERLDRVFRSQRFILGPEVAELETAFAEYVGVPHAVGCASGTDALLLVLKALDARPGDEVALPTFTFFATAGAAWNAGFRPAFCDVDEDTFNVSGETVARALSARTRAVVPVHLYGQMAPLAEVGGALAAHEGTRGREVFVLEDAAQSTGARQRVGDAELQAGAIGDAGAFSFFPTKNLGGSGDGGMITTADEALATRLRRLRVHGGLKMYHHDEVGTNSRLDTLQAAVLLAKLPWLEGWNEARRRHAAVYHEMLAGVDGVRTPVVAEGNVPTWNQYTLRVRDRDGLRAHLEARGIGSAVYYPVPLHLQPCFRELGHREGDFPVAERLAGEVVSLPVYPELGEERATRVAEAVRAFYEG